MQNIIILSTIAIISFILGVIKYGSISFNYKSPSSNPEKNPSNLSSKNSSWQIKFVEIWNDFANFFIAGVIGFYFYAVRLPLWLRGEVLSATDLILAIMLVLGVFGHLCVMSYNITEGVESILKKFLGKQNNE